MIYLNALDLLRRHVPRPFGWCEVVVGYDFGILTVREIQEWVRTMAARGPEAERLANLEGQNLLRFEETLWAACGEGTGRKAPRPGHQRWALAQDLWRIALLQETLDAPLDAEDFSGTVETIIDRVGCPEDMLGLLTRGFTRALTADRGRVDAFVRNLQAKLFPDGDDWAAAS